MVVESKSHIRVVFLFNTFLCLQKPENEQTNFGKERERATEVLAVTKSFFCKGYEKIAESLQLTWNDSSFVEIRSEKGCCKLYGFSEAKNYK